MKITGAAIAALLAACALQDSVSAPVERAPPEELTLEDLYKQDLYLGQQYFFGEWSHDDRYFALSWRPLKNKVADLWLYDVKTGKFFQLTSAALFGARDYTGVTGFSWAHGSRELVLECGGDLYRLRVGGKPVRLTNTGEYESNPEYGSDDRSVLYRRDSRVMEISLAGTRMRELTPVLPDGATLGSYSLSPDGSSLLYQVVFADPAEPHSFNYLDYQGRFPEVKTFSRYLGGDPFRDHIRWYVRDLNDPGKEPWEMARTAEGTAFELIGLSPAAAWSADSRTVVFSSWKSDTRKTTFKLATVARRTVADVHAVLQADLNGSSTPAAPQFERRGKTIAWFLPDIGTFGDMQYLDLASREIRQFADGAFNTRGHRLSEDRRRFYVAANRESYFHSGLYRVDLPGRQWHRLTRRLGQYSVLQPSHDDRHIAATFSSWTQLPELVMIGPEGERQVTQSHDMARFNALFRLVPQPFSFKNRQGQTLYGYTYLPPGFDTSDRRPLLFYAYGGPDVPARALERYEFLLYMAYKQGYVTAVIDPRGGPDYGRASLRSNWQAPGKVQVEDLIDAVAYLTARGGIDAQRVAFYGGSYSGYLAQLCMYTHPEVFKVAISRAGVTEWQNYDRTYVETHIGSTAAPLGEDLARFSLMQYVSGLQGPLLLMHGLRDPIVYFQDTMHVYQALLQAGKGPLVELVIDPTGGHQLGGVLDPAKRDAIIESFLLRRMPSAPFNPGNNVNRSLQ